MWITEMEEIMSEQNTTSHTSLAELAMRAAASGPWWREGKRHSDLELPSRVLTVLDNAGICTVEELKAAGPYRLANIEGLGKHGMDQIIALLRALDPTDGGGDA
jgi:hypothetical protein